MTQEEYDEARRRVHEAIGGLLDEGELAVCWVLTIDVVMPNGRRYLAHRAGGGHDGTEGPQSWTALGMLGSSALDAGAQLLQSTIDPSEDDEGGSE